MALRAADASIQATGRDAKGRKQYRYHARFREVRDGTKYNHMLAFAESLPAIRTKVSDHLSLRGLPREKVTCHGGAPARGDPYPRRQR
jgi:DNA topoisomerase I